jgi:hypothetical protein
VESYPPTATLELVRPVIPEHDLFVVGEITRGIEQRIAIPTDLVEQVAVPVALEIR